MAALDIQKPDYFTLSVAIGVGLLSLYAIYKNWIKPPEIGLDQSEYRKFRLAKKTNVSHNTRRFRFELQSSSTTLGLPIGKYISLRFFSKDENGEDEEIRRPYTPVTSDDDKGYFELVIKIYEDGRMSQYLDNLSIGQSIECRGPLGKIHYYAPGIFNFKLGAKPKDLNCKNIGMIAGGTGITPMLQVIRQIIKDECDDTRMSLIFGNVSIDDVLLKEELEEINRKHDNFHVYFTLDKAPENWTQGVGYVTQQMMQDHLPPPGQDTVILACGPPIMVKICCKTLVDKMNYDKDRILKF